MSATRRALNLTYAAPRTYFLNFGRADSVLFHPRSPKRPRPTQATLAQLVEHSIRNRKVVGSNPTGGSIKSNNLRESSRGNK